MHCAQRTVWLPFFVIEGYTALQPLVKGRRVEIQNPFNTTKSHLKRTNFHVPTFLFIEIFVKFQPITSPA